MAEAGAAAARDLTLPEHRARAKPYVDRAMAAVRALRHGAYGQPMRDVHEIMALVALEPDLQRSIVIDLLARRAAAMTTRAKLLSFRSPADDAFSLGRAQGVFASRVIPFTTGDAAILMHLTAEMLRGQGFEANEAVAQTVLAVERVVQRDGSTVLRGGIEDLIAALGAHGEGGGTPAKQRARLAALLADASATVDAHMVTDGDSWGSFWKAEIQRLPASLHPLLVQLTLASTVDPPQKWKARTRELVKEREARALLQRMLTGVETTKATTVTWELRQFLGPDAAIPVPSFQERNVLVLRGVLWAAALTGADWAIERLSTLGLLFGTSGSGDNMAREERLANTCAAALGSIDTEAAFAGLGRMKAKVINRNVSKQIAKALGGAAARRGTSASELLELAVPTMGLNADGRLETTIGEQTARLALDDRGAPTLTWRDADGTERATPAKLTADAEPRGVQQAKDALKDLKKAATVERGRIEDLFVEDRTWDLATWRTRYLEHPLTGAFGRRLIWRFVAPDGAGGAAVLPDGGGFVDAAGATVEPTTNTKVRLWHPIEASEAEIAAWRTAILARRIRQPFKQAYREVYRLTPAEEQTETYSNRFAAHILMYAQARALMTVRRWGSNFLGPYDGGFEGLAKREFPSHGIRAEFFHEALEDEMAGGDVVHCATDQVRFVTIARGAGAAIVPLRDVPPVVLSEAMRDVDLFVGVTSIAADRNWQDWGEGRAGRYAQLDAYFVDYASQELTANAQVRRDAIARLLPGLVIADRAELQERHLRVRGDLRTYRIHLGSGNIYMEPSDTYLCIVPARGRGMATDKVFLPFDDDPMLGLILSKAFLLASDKAISETTITHQIRRG